MHYTRAQIGLRPPLARYKLDPTDVEGVALHWPATTTRYTTVKAVMAGLRAWQAYHMDTHGWSDIAYQIAVDQAGNWYQLRGLRHRSGANGDDEVNSRYGAILLVVAEAEEPTPAMIATVNERLGRFKHLFPREHLVVGHNDVRPEPTACPGPAINQLLDDGAFHPTKEHP